MSRGNLPVKLIDCLGVAGLALFCYASYKWIDWKSKRDPYPWLTRFKREVERRNRYTLAGMFVFHLLIPIMCVTLDCELRTCLQRTGYLTTSGCVLDCVFNHSLVYRGPCDEVFQIMRWNISFPRKDTRDIQSTILNLGLRYYLEGHVLAHVTANLHLKSSKLSVVEHLVCTKDEDGMVNGTMSLNWGLQGIYNFSSVTNRTYDTNKDVWTSPSKNRQKTHNTIVSFLNQEAENDFEFLKEVCHRLVNKRMKKYIVVIGRRVNRLKNEQVCRMRSIPVDWHVPWINWTKFTVIPKMRWTVLVDTELVRNRVILTTIGMCILGSGMFLMLGMFFMVILWRRHDLISDLRKPPVTKSPIFFTKASGDV
ncbi:envelope glycoprotein UL37 [Saimiriine betaherpesvirus 4]|uniref:Envelope glycoprotein UL37 n=1 Tax=Saimiriine betaherpesvirus 4 TaxID=1535247 RepID=G8XSV1_9BETA|nr:envelope glycoprotein UL37 [Saimiriine betaherpesvirus 4]AEV80898.1 envelope glycoprotein UL37 [Saimiriine betaherpesvirus 4]